MLRMKQPFKSHIPLKTRLKYWWDMHGTEATAISIGAVACTVFGAIVLDPPKHVGFEKAIVTYYGVREGSETPGVRLWVANEDGQTLIVDSNVYNPDLKIGAQVCLLHTKGQVTGGHRWELTLPRNCLT